MKLFLSHFRKSLRFSGPLDPVVVLRAICTGYANEPMECEDLKSRQANNVNNDVYIFGQGYSSSTGGVAWWVYFVTIVGSLSICTGVIVSYRYVVICSRLEQLKTSAVNDLRLSVSPLKFDSQMPT